MKPYWLLFFLLLCLPNFIQANEILDNFFRGLHNLQAQFEQNLFNEKGRLLEKVEGNMTIQRSNKFNWEYKKPYSQQIIADGKNIWIYDKDLNQVTKKTMNSEKVSGKMLAFLLNRKRNIEEDFLVTQLSVIQQTKITNFELISKDNKNQFDKVYISIRGKDLLGFKFVDNLGQTTLITFTQVKRNQKLAKDLFLFTPPKGVDVIETGYYPRLKISK
ncbi:outer membrane lipoprotein chaperone LolA [Thiotrichales bacterium HSG1]|nr:outer membrane lipoprotein chaperone LolA [Thiotrichales bacterium HSG1]